MALLGVLVFAALSLGRIPGYTFPRLNLPTIYIAQLLGGMTAAQMEGFIATHYQNQMLYVSGVKDVTVKNIQGLCLVKCTFCEAVNMAQAAGEVARPGMFASANIPINSPKNQPLRTQVGRSQHGRAHLRHPGGPAAKPSW